jgi:hypothetical protein
MSHKERATEEELGHEIAISNRVHAGPADGSEAKLGGHEVAVNGVGHSRQRPAAERQTLTPGAAAWNRSVVPREHLE